MNEIVSKDKKLINVFDRMWLDSLLSLQPSGTYVEAWNAVTTTDEENSYGISNEPANELFVDLPGEVRGMIYVEERDQYVVFLDTDKGGEIGIIDEKGKCYTAITNTEIAPELGICQDQWIDSEVKVVQPCNHLYLYWSSGDVYKRLNLDDPCCEFDEIDLIKPICVATIETKIIEGGGNLPNGVYQFAAKVRDAEGNDTNWSRISNAISVSDLDFKAGENSNKAINLEINVGLNRDYHLMDLAVIKTINGITTVEQFTTTSVSSNTGVFNYVYNGVTGQEFPIQISDILTRVNRYIRGKNLIQYDNRLVLYNLRQIHSLDYQRQANQIKAKYINYVIPLEYAHLFKGLRPNENYWFAIRWNYEDGTSSVNYPIPGLPGPNSCDDWRNNAKRTKLYYDIDNLDYEADFGVGDNIDNTPEILLEDESSSVIVTDDDNPTIGDEILTNMQKYGSSVVNPSNALDCLCDKINKGVYLPGFPLANGDEKWDIDGDVLGYLTIDMIRCMCENRANESDPGDVSEDVGDNDLFQPEDETIVDCGENCVCINGECKPIDQLRFSDANIDGVKALEMLDLIETRDDECEGGSCVEPNQPNPNDTRSEGTNQVVGARCSNENAIDCAGNVCKKCVDGVWVDIQNTVKIRTSNSYTKERKVPDTTVFKFNTIYAEDGCTPIGVEPVRFAEGDFGGWETQGAYPETLDCNCDYIYGGLAGKNVRLHKVPGVNIEPHFMSFSSGVPNKHDMANSEFKESFMFMIGAEFDNITLPKNPPKPLCKKTPYSITFVERTESNKSILGSGTAHSCFLGEIGGEDYAFSKHASNSFERFDRHIEPSGSSTFRGGKKLPDDKAAYVTHSPDFHMRRPSLDVDYCLFEMELIGKGYKHGHFSEGDEPEHPSQDKINSKGTRLSLNLNHYGRFSNQLVRKVKGISYAPADSVVDKSNKFTYNLCNLYRESSVYFELEGGLVPFSQSDSERGMSGMYGGESNVGDNASDRSFTGDIYTESMPIHDVRNHMVTFVRRLPSQYGSVINQAYVPLGLEAKSFSPKISGLVGDSFVGPMTYKRSALISDKTNRKISKFAAVTGFSGKGLIMRIFGNLLATMFRVLGVKNGGYIPVDQDSSDHIRIFGGLRFINPTTLPITDAVENPGEITVGKIPPPFPKNGYKNRTSVRTDVNFGDNYVPQHLTTQMTSFFNSDVNLNYRVTNSVDNGEVYYSQNSATLKGLKIDSSIPEDTHFLKGWINRLHSLWVENASWKLIVQAVLILVFTYFIGLFVMLKGVEYVIVGLSVFGGGTYGLQTVGGVLAVALGVLFVIIGWVWIKYWVNSDTDNKFFGDMLRLKNLKPDRRNVDKSFSFNESRIRNFEDNYWRCDNTHSQVNRWEVSYGMSDPYNTCVCPTEYHNKILYSNRQTMDSQIDTWRNFKPNNSLEIPSDHGQIQKMFKLGNTLYAHTTDMLIQLHRGGGGFSLNEDNVLLGTGDLFSIATPVYGGVVEGYAGLLDPNAAEVSAYGYIFPDREARKWFRFTGGQPTPISNQGVKHFMDENMNLSIVDKFPDFKLVDLKLKGGVGFSFGIDHQNQRLLFTKVDFDPIYDDIKLNEDNVTFSKDGDVIALGDPKYFDDKSFTLSYSLRNEGWISFHNYLPVLYAWNRFDMYSFADDKMWIHNVKGKFQTYYGNHYPFSVEYVVNDKEQGDSFSYVGSIIGSEAYQWKVRDYINKVITFDQMIGYNSHHATGLKNFVNTDTLSLSDRSKEFHDRVKINFKNRIWTFKDVSNYLIDGEDFIFDPKYVVGPKPINKDNISNDIKNNIFYDNFFANRLIFSKFDDVKLILKRVETNITYESR